MALDHPVKLRSTDTLSVNRISAGEGMRFRVRWSGPLPRTGDYLVGPTRRRLVHRVRTVARADPHVCWDPVCKSEYRYLTIDVDRVPIDSMLKTSRVLTWRNAERRRVSTHTTSPHTSV